MAVTGAERVIPEETDVSIGWEFEWRCSATHAGGQFPVSMVLGIAQVTHQASGAVYAGRIVLEILPDTQADHGGHQEQSYKEHQIAAGYRGH